jgi:2-oxoglutarate ferredoxin oxidoreductase subunit delta
LATSVQAAAATASTTASVGVRGEPPIDIATDRCKGCELCIGICPKHVLELDPSVVNVLGHHPVRLTDGEACTSCALCARICPDAVFTIYRPRSLT